ncbi:MAG: hypothetical protein HC896_04190 [Bacteroidales bacterium]|nr:hypothetical protein [Bacteroidales bacterium]
MLHIFINNAENAVQLFKEYLQAENWQQIGETAHKMLPSFKHLEAKSITKKLIAIKNSTITEHSAGEDVARLLKETIDKINQLINNLKDEIK